MKKSPLQQVRDQFGSKKDLVERLLPLVERLHSDESDAEYARRLGTASNKQLLRMWTTAAAVKEKFSTRAALVDAVVKAKFGKENNDYRDALGRLTNARLLDLHRQLKG